MSIAPSIAPPEIAWCAGVDPLTQLTIATFSGYVGDASRLGVMPVSTYFDLFEAVGTNVDRDDLLHMGGVAPAYTQSRWYFAAKVAERRSVEELATSIRAIGRLAGGTEATDRLADWTAEDLKSSDPSRAFDALWALSTLAVLRTMPDKRGS
jgi:hypothetical protein